MNFGGGGTVQRTIGAGRLTAGRESDLKMPVHLLMGDTFQIRRGDFVASYCAPGHVAFNSWTEVRAFMQCAPQVWAGDVFAIMSLLTAEYGQ